MIKNPSLSVPIRLPDNEMIIDINSDNWIEEHYALTKNGSLVIGLIRDRDGFASWRHYIDCNVLPKFFKCINDNIDNRKIYYFYEDNLVEEMYIKNILNMKYENKIIYNILDKKIIRKIQEIESMNNLALITTSTSCVFALKYLIERN